MKGSGGKSIPNGMKAQQSFRVNENSVNTNQMHKKNTYSLSGQEQINQMQPPSNSNKGITNLQSKYTVEKEDDMHQQQQVSGAFGNSEYMDESMIQQLILQQQQQALNMEKENPNKWEEESIQEEYIMESNMFDFEEVRKQESFGLKKYQDAIYRGLLLNGKRSGQGIMMYKKNRVYEGDWLNDVRHGKGYERYQNNNKYEGEFQNGKAHGKGVYSWLNGEVYDGEWKNGVKEGYGVWKGIFGDSYIGEWKNSKADGYGVHQWKNGDRYEGEWKNCLKHGQGSDIFANQDTYTGTYKFGKPDGLGQYKWKNGSLYIGEFKDGQKHGKGKWKKQATQSNCNCYEGEYLFDKKNGQGIFQWESGNIYKGSYKDDERHGYGEMFWVDGSVYKGEWFKGIQHGRGRMVFPDGTVKEGVFENNIFLGQELQVKSSQNSNRSQSQTSAINKQQVQQIIQSRGSSELLIRTKTPGKSNHNSVKRVIKSPQQLNPVLPPQKKVDLNSSTELDNTMMGYSSQGVVTDNDSKVSYTMKGIQTTNNKDSQQNSMISKIVKYTPQQTSMMKNKPNQTNFHNSSINSSGNNHQADYGSGNESTFLPDIKKRMASKSSQRTQNTVSTDMTAIKRASPEAIALMMKNIQKGPISKKDKAWVPSGAPKKEQKPNAKNLFFQ